MLVDTGEGHDVEELKMVSEMFNALKSFTNFVTADVISSFSVGRQNPSIGGVT